MDRKIFTKWVAFSFTALLGIFFLIPQVSAAPGNWDIQNFTTNIFINPDGSILVTEKITVDFSREKHHGIFRLIPLNYQDDQGRKSSLALKVVSVKDNKGQPWNYQKTREGNYLNLKIGDADKYLNAFATFIIEYQAWGAIGYFDTHDELYWNATGNVWEVPIKKAEATILLPAPTKKEELQTKCFTGEFGSKAQDCSSVIADEETFQYSTTKPLSVGEGLTLVAGFPKAIVSATPAPPPIDGNVDSGDYGFMTPITTAELIFRNWGFALPIVSFFILFLLWYSKGRDPKISRSAIMPLYTPPDNLTPTEVGALLDESVDMRDITSTIIDLAIKGYIKIVELKEKVILWNSTDYEFQKIKEYDHDSQLKNHEKAILDALFQSSKGKTSVRLSDLENRFYVHIPSIQAKIYSSLVEEGYFPTSPETVRKMYMGLGVGLVFFGFFGLQFFAVSGSFSIPIGVALSGIPLLIFGYYMPAKTSKGVEAKYKILGLKEYINTAEKDRIKFQEKETSTISKEHLFEKLLPYAMTLGIAEKWTEAFKGIYQTPPSWYHSTDPYFINNFSAIYFINRLNSISSRMNSTFTSRPASRSSGSGFSSGGGFSGGGGGGGGGGSW